MFIVVQQEQINRNIVLYACEGETHLEHDLFVYEHYIGTITSGKSGCL
jgi:hypothetical protein